MKKTIELIPLWTTKEWSEEIKSGRGFLADIPRSKYESPKPSCVVWVDGIVEIVDAKHAHKSLEEAKQKAREELRSYIKFHEKQIVEYSDCIKNLTDKLTALE